MSDTVVRIFVSSPADVDHERAVVKDIVEQLATEYLPYFELRTVLWEEEALTADRTFQAGLTQPQDCDIVLVILWTRLGSPLPQEPYRGMTGTEWEFVNAVEASAQAGSPEVLVYKKSMPKLVDITDAGLAREAIEDRRRLEEFFRTHFFFEDNSFRRAFRTFDNASAFRELVATQLRKLLNRRISAERRAATGELHWQGSPFRPDRPFDTSDERIFTGREQEVRELLRALERFAMKRTRRTSRANPVSKTRSANLLLLTGPSGCGKTSLLRAGVLPRLTRPFQFDGIAAVWVCLVAPTEDSVDPLAILAEALCAQASLGPLLAGFGLRAPALRRLLHKDPELAAQQIASAMAQRTPGTASRDGHRLLLLLDPFDSLLEQASDKQLLHLAEALQALAFTPAIWIIALLRSDAVPALERLPALRASIRAQGWTEIEPPSAARIRQVVEIPARVAGIDLDTHRLGERELVEQLEADASRLRLWPSLLQPVLEAAYQRAQQRQASDGGELWLSGADYQAAGGIGRQVLTRAAQVWRSVDAEAHAALPRLCRALITLEGGALARPTIRHGNLELLRRDPACKRLLERLIEARLIISEGLHDPTLSIHCDAPEQRIRAEPARIWRQTWHDWRRRRQRPPRGGPDPEPPAAEARTDGASTATAVVAGDTAQPVDASADADTDTEHQDWREYQAVVSFSHPWLLTHWEPVHTWLAVPANRQWLARRFQLDRQAQLWKRTNCNSEYLLRDAGSAEALALQETYAEELEPLEHEFIDRSKAHVALLRRRRLMVRLVGLVLAALVLISALSAGLAYHAYTDAQINLSRSKLNEANLSINRGNTPQAVDLALGAGADLPQRAVQTLGLAFSSNRLLAMAAAVNPVPDEPRLPSLNAAGSHLATFLPGRGATLLALEQGRFEPIQTLADPALGVHTLVFGPNTRVVGIGAEGLWRLPAAAGAEPDYPCGSSPGLSMALDERRQRLALSRPGADGQPGLCVVDLEQPGRVILDKPLADGPLRSLSFAPDGQALLTAAASGRTRLIDLQSGAVTLSLPRDKATGRPFNRAVFDARGERIAIASADERIRLYQRDGEPIAELSSARIGGGLFSMHRSAVRDVAFDPSGAFLVAADDEGQIVRWTLSDEARGTEEARPPRFDQAVVLSSHRLSAGSVRIIEPPAQAGFDESLVLSASLDGTAKLTGLQTGKPIAVLGHDAAITSADFHAGGERVATFSARDETVRLWSVKPVSRLAYRLRHPDHVWSVDTALAPPAIARGSEALLLATAGFDGGVRVWRYSRQGASSQPTPWVAFLDDDAQRPVRQVRFSPSGRRLVSAHDDGTARIADLIDKRLDCRLQVTESDRGEVYNALFSPDAGWVLTTSNDPSAPVRAFSSETCEPLHTGDWPDAGLQHGGRAIEAAAVASTATGTLVATGDEAGILRLAERTHAGRWQHRCSIEAGVGAIGDIALSPDASRIAVAGEANRAALIRLDAPAALRAADASFTADAFLASQDAVTEDAATKTDCGSMRFLEGHSDRLYSIAFAPDGKQLVTASLDKTARLWDQHGEPIAILVGHQDRIYHAEFSPDGRWLLTGSRDGSLRIWKRPQRASDDVARLSTFLPLEADAGGVANAVFSPDGHYVAGAYWENAAILWRLWAEDAEAPGSARADWGSDRSALALVREAYRFRRDNQVAEPTASDPESSHLKPSD